MKRSAIEISGEVLGTCPDVAIGYLVAGNLRQVAGSAKTSGLLDELASVELPQGLDLQNLVELPQVARWREVYMGCGVKPKTYKSSVESLMRRLLKNEYRPVAPLVDIYNYISAAHILSAGGYDWGKLTGTLSLRYGLPEDQFIPLNGREEIAVEPGHILYADEAEGDNVVCWMWNHKDSRRTMLTEETDRALFIFDALHPDERDGLEQALEQLACCLSGLGAEIKVAGILDGKTPMLFL
jgi:lysyl-tRNA synthetase class 2